MAAAVAPISKRDREATHNTRLRGEREREMLMRLYYSGGGGAVVVDR